MNKTEIEEYLARDTGYAPCCPWGSHPDDFTPAIVGLANLYADSEGGEVTADQLDAAASAVVNCGDAEATELHSEYPDFIPAPR